MRFTKMHGTGNDYVYVDLTQVSVADPVKLAVKVSDRHFGIGADGLVLIDRASDADFSMDMYNADGSRGRMCGNAIRCVGKYVYDCGYTDKQVITVSTLSGIKRLVLNLVEGKVDSVKVDMGAPLLSPRDIPCVFEGDSVINKPISLGGFEDNITCVSMGNPHAVIFVNDVEDAPVHAFGRLIETSSYFPDRVNVEFVKVHSPDRLSMRVWERGSGETYACGTGACAAVVAAHLCGHASRSATVCLSGGELFVEWDTESGNVFMTGGATRVFDGDFFMEDK